MKWLVLFLAFLASSSSDAVSTPTEKATCEYLLRNSAKTKALETAHKQLFEKPFIFQSASDGIQPLALEKLGLLDVFINKGPDHLVLSLLPEASDSFILNFQFQNFEKGQLDNIYSGQLLDKHPMILASFETSQTDLQLSYDDFVKKNPPPSKLNPLWREPIGFATGFSRSQTRRYVSATYYRSDYTIVLEIGLDVPCEKLHNYVTDAWYNLREDEKIITSQGTYCRVPVIAFIRQTFQPR